MHALPFVDEHTVAVTAPRDAVWASLLDMLRDTIGSSSTFARALRCDPPRGTAQFEGKPGQTLPGFRVVDAEAGARLVLEGRHRFSRYRLTFHLDGDRLRARTEAEFPGLRGRLYRMAVIGTRAHAAITRRMLRRVSSRA